MKDAPRRQAGGLSLKTLLIAGAASATASLVVPLFWRPGTVFAAAVTPIIVAIAQELFRKPVETVSAVTARRTAGGAVIFDPPPERPFEPPPERPFDPLAPAPTEELEALSQTTTRRTVTRRRRLTARRVRLALLTGVIAFAGAVGVVTASELVAGESVGRGTDNPTTFFGGRSEDRDEPEEATPTPTPTPTPTATPTPGETGTPTPTSTPTPAPTATPAPAEPAPQSAPPASPTPAP